jgi:hypothetical protein
MNNFFFKKVVFVVPMLLVSATAFSFSQFFPSDHTSKATSYKKTHKAVSTKPSVRNSPEGISIIVTEGVLGNVLQVVANQTDIRFRVANKLVNNRITADVRAPDWSTGIQKLLKSNSTISLWDENSNITNVVVMKSHKGKEQFSKTPNLSNQHKNPKGKIARISRQRSAKSS